ncbi:MAG: hypothetical protein AB1403_06020 [Candidatus Riflebacteria bacterium]
MTATVRKISRNKRDLKNLFFNIRSFENKWLNQTGAEKLRCHLADGAISSAFWAIECSSG